MKPITFTQADVVDVANDFVLILQDWLTDDEFYDVQKLNAAEEDSDVCHSHDFCDANMAMQEAMKKRGFKCEGDPDVMRWGILWSAAWDHAKKSDLTLKGD